MLLMCLNMFTFTKQEGSDMPLFFCVSRIFFKLVNCREILRGVHLNTGNR